jgi:hypothetical protein
MTVTLRDEVERAEELSRERRRAIWRLADRRQKRGAVVARDTRC